MGAFLNILIRIATLLFLIVLIVKQVKNVVFDILERKKHKEVKPEYDRCSDSSSNNWDYGFWS